MSSISSDDMSSAEIEEAYNAARGRYENHVIKHKRMVQLHAIKSAASSKAFVAYRAALRLPTARSTKIAWFTAAKLETHARLGCHVTAAALEISWRTYKRNRELYTFNQGLSAAIDTPAPMAVPVVAPVVAPVAAPVAVPISTEFNQSNVFDIVASHAADDVRTIGSIMRRLRMVGIADLARFNASKAVFSEDTNKLERAIDRASNRFSKFINALRARRRAEITNRRMRRVLYAYSCEVVLREAHAASKVRMTNAENALSVTRASYKHNEAIMKEVRAIICKARVIAPSMEKRARSYDQTHTTSKKPRAHNPTE
jgi:hypothetical protein